MASSLSTHSIFGKLSPEVQDALSQCARPVSFARCERLVGPGATPAVHLLVKGLAERRLTGSAAEKGPMWLVGPGEIVGTSAILPAAVEDSEVVALERVQTLRFTPRDLMRLGREHPAILFALAEDTARRIESLAGQALAATTGAVAARLAQLLLDVAPPAVDDRFVPFEFRLTHRTLARAVGASRPYTTVILGELERRGAIRRENRRLFVRRDALRAIALAGAEG